MNDPASGNPNRDVDDEAKAQAGPEINPYSAPQTDQATAARLRWSFSVPMAFALIAIVAVTGFLNLGLGIALAAVTIPAYIRAVRRSSIRFTEGENVTDTDRVLSFLGSLVLVLVCAGSAFVAFFITCTGSFATGAVESVAISAVLIISACVGLLAFGWLYWWWWPKRNTKRPAIDPKNENQQ